MLCPRPASGTRRPHARLAVAEGDASQRGCLTLGRAALEGRRERGRERDGAPTRARAAQRGARGSGSGWRAVRAARAARAARVGRPARGDARDPAGPGGPRAGGPEAEAGERASERRAGGPAGRTHPLGAGPRRGGERQDDRGGTAVRDASRKPREASGVWLGRLTFLEQQWGAWREKDLNNARELFGF